MNEMTPEQALQLIDRVLADVVGTRLDHQRLQQALAVLVQAVCPPTTTSSEIENVTH